MEVKIIEREGNELKFLLSGVKPSFSNALRRAMMVEVPKLAIDELNIHENTSVLYNEQLALRLALIPLKTNLGSYVFREECECEEGCPLCQVSLCLNAESAKNEGYTMVYSKDLVSSDPEVVPVCENIPIIKLVSREKELEGIKMISRQKISLEAIARLGRGKEHAKWQPVTACGYKNLPQIKIKECNACGNCMDVCPKGIIVIDNVARIKDAKECSLCGLCEEACDIDAIEVSIDKNSFIFNLESDGSLPVDEIVIEAARILGEKCTKVMEDLKNILP